MEQAKKMLLIEPSLMDKLKYNQVPDSPTSRLDAEMKNILNSNMDDRKKSILYLQILQRYLHFTEEDRQPHEIPIITKNIETTTPEVKINTSNKSNYIDDKSLVTAQVPNTEDKNQESATSYEKLPYTKDQILRLIPKTYVKKGESLLGLLSLSKNKIYWNDDGTVIIDNEKIPGSNIVDLLNDSIRPLKKSEPIGWKKFATALKDIKVPLTYVGNPARSEYIHQLQLKDIGQVSTDEEFNDTNNLKKVKKRIKKTIAWEKWTPY